MSVKAAVMEVVDVFETSDLPEVDQAMAHGDVATDSVDTLSISANEAFERFKEAYIDSNKVDFSDRLRHTRKKGYNIVWSGESSKPVEETPIKKYQRLNCEVRELLDDIGTAKKSQNSGLEDHTLESLSGQVEILHKQLLQLRLENVLGEETVNSMTDPQAAARQKLLSQLTQLKSGVNPTETAPVSKTCNTPSYSLYIKPASVALSEGALLADLDSRLSLLVRRVGLHQGDVSGAQGNQMSTLTMETGKKNLVQAIQVLSAKTTLLDPNNLANVEGRLSALQQKLGHPKDEKSSLDSESLEKLDSLVKVVERSQPMYANLPTVIQRLETLQSLHQQAADLSRGLVELETVQQQLSVQLGNNQSLLSTTSKRFSANLETINANFTSLTKRIDLLKQK